MSETVCTDRQVVPDEILERVPDHATGNWKGPAALSVSQKHGTSSSWLQNAGAIECRHRWPGHSSPA